MPNPTMLLNDDELDIIEQRAELTFRYGDVDALRPEDVAELLYAVRELQRQNAHLVALQRQTWDKLVAERVRYRGRL